MENKSLHKLNKRRFRAGFTAIEVISVVAIIGILAASSVPPMLGAIEHGKQTNRMNMARTIYLAAQNRLTEKRIALELRDFVESGGGSFYSYDDVTSSYILKDDSELLSLSTNVSAAVDVFSDSGNEPYVHFIRKDEGYYPDSQVHKLLDPVIIDKTLLNEAILIEYNIKTGIVLSAFYGDTVSRLGYASIDGSITANENVDGERPYDRDLAHFRKQGYYGVSQTLTFTDDLAEAPVINVYDGALDPLTDDTGKTYKNVLYAQIFMPRSLLENGQKYDLAIGGHVVRDAFTDYVSTSYDLSTLASVPTDMHIIYERTDDADENYRSFIWLLDYASNDMTEDGYGGRSIGVKLAGSITPDKNMTIALADEAGFVRAYSNEFNPCYLTDTNASYKQQLQISTARHLYNIRYKTDGNFALINDVDMLPGLTVGDDGDEITTSHPDALTNMYGTSYKDADGASIPFAGTFTGNGYAISNLRIDNDSENSSDINGFFEKSDGIIEDVTFINPKINAATTSGVITGENNGVIRDVVIISGSDLSPFSDGVSIGGIAGINDVHGRISRALYLAPAPERDGVIYPIAHENNGTVHNPSVIYLSGAEVRPQPVTGGYYNPPVKALFGVGTAKSTLEIFNQGNTDYESPFDGYKLNTAVTDPLQSVDTDSAGYPYPYRVSSDIFDGYSWPITGIAGVSLRYYEVYEKDNFVGYYYYEPESGNINNTLRKDKRNASDIEDPKSDDPTLVIDDGYIVTSEYDIELTIGTETKTYTPENLRLGGTTVRGVDITYGIIDMANTTPVSISANGLLDGLYVNPLFAKQIFLNDTNAPGKQSDIKIRSPRQLLNITKSAGVAGVTYNQELNLDFSEYSFERYDAHKRDFTGYESFVTATRNADGRFNGSVVNEPFAGRYNGEHRRITGLDIDADGSYAGIFSENGGEIRNVHIYDSSIKGDSYVGALVGHNTAEGKVSAVSAVDTYVNGMDVTGGIAGENEGKVTDAFFSYTSGEAGAAALNPQVNQWVAGVKSDRATSAVFGGLIGENSGILENSYAAAYVGGDNDETVKPLVGSGAIGENAYYLHGDMFNSRESYSPVHDGILNARQLSALVTDASFGSDIFSWSKATQEFSLYPYPLLEGAKPPDTWCEPEAPIYRIKYYELYKDDGNAKTLDYGLWGDADDDTLQNNRTIITDGYLVYTKNSAIRPETIKLTIHPTQDGGIMMDSELYSGDDWGYLVNGLFGETAIVLSTKILEEASLGLSPIYLNASWKNGGDEERPFAGMINPLFAKGKLNGVPSEEEGYEYSVRTPRHLQNIGSTVNSSNDAYKSPLSGSFIQETNVVFTDLNDINKKGYVKVENPSGSFEGANATKLVFLKAGVLGEFTGSYNGSFNGKTNQIIDFTNTGTNQSGVGIFEEIGADGGVESLIVSNGRLSGSNTIGGVAGTNNGTIKSVHVICGDPESNGITGIGSFIGGIAGRNGGVIEMCAVENLSIKGASAVGGITGLNDGGVVRDVYYIDTRSSINPLKAMITSTSENDDMFITGAAIGGIIGNNAGTVTRALYLGIAPKSKAGNTTTIYPIVGAGTEALTRVSKGETTPTCFFASGSAYSLTMGSGYNPGEYNDLSESTDNDNPTVLSGGGQGYDTAFLELEFVAMMDMKEVGGGSNWDNWTYGARAGSKPYPYAIIDGMIPPGNWHEVSSSGKPAQEERPSSVGWLESIVGSARTKNLSFINPDFELPLNIHGVETPFFTGTTGTGGRNFVRYYRGPGQTNEYYSHTMYSYLNFYPSTAIQGWNTRLTKTTGINYPNNTDAMQLLSVYYTTGASTATNTASGRVRSNYLGNADNATAGVYMELSALDDGMPFQICQTVPHTELYYSFYHAARNDNAADSMNFCLTGVKSNDPDKVEYTSQDGKTFFIRPCLTIRGSDGDRRTRRTVSYAYKNGASGTAAMYNDGVNGVVDTTGRSTFYDPNSKTRRTAYLYDVWVASEGYGITFWSNDRYTANYTGNNPDSTQLRREGVSTISAGSGSFGSNSGALAAAQNNIIGYWDAKVVNYGGTSNENRDNGKISEWKQYYGKYTIPSGQDFTEFAFQYRDSTSSESYFGNLLDGIFFETPSYVTISKSLYDDKLKDVVDEDGNKVDPYASVVYKNPGEVTDARLTVKNWGEVTAKNIVITDTIAPYDEYIDIVGTFEIVVKDVNGAVKGTFDKSIVNVNGGKITVTMPGSTLAMNETITVTFPIKVRETLKDSPGFDTFGYYAKNQAEVYSHDTKYIGYEKTNYTKAQQMRSSNIVHLFIDPISLSKTAAENLTDYDEKDGNNNQVQYYDVKLTMDSTFKGTTVSGLINDAIPKGFSIVGDVVVTKTHTGEDISIRVVENGDGTTTLVASGITLTNGDNVVIAYTLKYTGNMYGTIFSNIEANYKYQYVNDSGKRMTGAVQFPEPVVFLNVKTCDDAYSAPANSAEGVYLDIGANDYASDGYHVSQGEYDTVDRSYVLLDENGDEAAKDINGRYELTGTGYTATLIGDRILLKTAADMPDSITLKYKVALDAVPKDAGKRVTIDSRDTIVTVSRQ